MAKTPRKRTRRVRKEPEVTALLVPVERIERSKAGEARTEPLDVFEHSDQHCTFRAEQIVGRGEAHPGFCRERTHRKPGIASLADQVARRFDNARPPFRLCRFAPVFHLAPPGGR